MDVIDLSIFSNRIDALCEEMGAVLRRTAFSPNIVDRLDFSCAIFDQNGRLCAQAAHIPVHLGSMAYAMTSIVSQVQWADGDMLILNDPFLGGTHLPDVTMVAPVYINDQLCAFIANRAHHADIGADAPGSMPISKSLDEEGMIIAPTHIMRDSRIDESVMDKITCTTRHPGQARGDFSAQISANRSGLQRLQELVTGMGLSQFIDGLDALNAYASRLAQATLAQIPSGHYEATDYMDDDGMGNTDIIIKVKVDITDTTVDVDFTGTADQVQGNINCPLSVTAASVYYVFRCLMPDFTPACFGSFEHIRIHAPAACLLNAQRPAAVAAGNVETSTRIVDVLLLALSEAIPDYIPAASHGSMNNLAMGVAADTQSWDYYETIGGGMGAHPLSDGLSAVQTHMTNTLNTPIEVLEMRYPVRLHHYGIRNHSGGQGQHNGGDGIIREFEFLQPASFTLLTERRTRTPWGLAGGEPGLAGANLFNNKPLPGKVSVQASSGDRLCIKTAGGGGWNV